VPDWHKIVRRRLADLALEEGEREEVVTELAGHLEEAHEALRREGLPEHEAIRGALSQVRNWNRLQRRICAAKEHPMKQRVRQLWIPGFLTFALSIVFLTTLQRLGFRPRVLGDGPRAILFYMPWLVSLVFCGAFGAYLASRARASREVTLLASAFPVLALTTAFLLMFPIDMIVKWIIGSPVDFAVVATSILKDSIGWLLLPGAALFVGGLLVQLLLSPRSSRDCVIG
jgi:hypothetical protein